MLLCGWSPMVIWKPLFWLTTQRAASILLSLKCFCLQIYTKRQKCDIWQINMSHVYQWVTLHADHITLPSLEERLNARNDVEYENCKAKFFFVEMALQAICSVKFYELKFCNLIFSETYFTFTLALCGLASLFQVWVLHLHHRGDQRMSEWTAFNVLQPLATITLTDVPGFKHFRCITKQVK